MSSFSLTNFGAARLGDSPKNEVVRMNASLETLNQGAFLEIVGELARQTGVSALSHELTMTREGIYKSFQEDGNPTLDTTLRMLDALGFTLSIDYKSAPDL